MASPYERFLGVQETADAYALLALSAGQTNPRIVQRALEAQLARVDRHPDAASREAAFIRERLHAASRAILTGQPQYVGNAGQPQKQSPQPTQRPAASSQPTTTPRTMPAPARPGPASPQKQPPPVPLRPAFHEPPRASDSTGFQNGPHTRLELTAFDRHVLAILIASGGWNAQSRARLVALAGANHVSPRGLMKVVHGLSEYGRSHGQTRLDTAQITEGKALRMDMMLPESTADASAEMAEVWRDQHGDAMHGSVWATVKLSLLFGAATLLLGVLFVNTLLRPDPAPRPRPGTTPAQAGSGAPAGAGERTTNAPEWETGALSLAQWPEPPTFYADPTPPEAARAADQSPRLPDQFDALARQLTVTQFPDGEFRTTWRTLINQVGVAWPLIDQATFDATVNNLVGTLLAAADRPSLADQLLTSVSTPASEPGTPLDLWRGAWSVGVLAVTAGRNDAPLALRQSVIERLNDALGRTTDPDDYAFEPAARAWLLERLPHLVEMTEFDNEAYQYWELWLGAQRALKEGATFDDAVMSAVEMILATSVDLAQPGRTVNVLGRLVHAADFQRSAVVKERIVDLYDHPSVDARDVWVLGSLLAQSDAAPWFNEALVPDHQASLAERSDVRRMLESRWPQLSIARPSGPAGQGIPIDPELGSRWLQAVETQLNAVDRLSGLIDDRDRIMPLLLAAWLNEAAAALAADDARGAREALAQFEDVWLAAGDQAATPAGGGRGNAARPSPPVVPHRGPVGGGGLNVGKPVGPDGVWTREFEEARTGQVRIELIRQLRSEAGTDLGPTDARTLVHQAYRGVPASVRDEARIVLLELFQYGPNVALELINQFEDAPRADLTGDFVAQVTGRIIPESQAGDWTSACRLALSEHFLQLHETASGELDAMVRTLATSYGEQFGHLRPDLHRMDGPLAADAALLRLFGAFREDASSLMVADPLPGPLAWVERRHGTRYAMAEGPIERAVAVQITVLELLAYTAAAEQPAKRDHVAALLARVRMQRRDARHILEQATYNELAILELWRTRLSVGRRGESGQGGAP